MAPYTIVSVSADGSLDDFQADYQKRCVTAQHLLLLAFGASKTHHIDGVPSREKRQNIKYSQKHMFILVFRSSSGPLSGAD